jgi:hypothetical protein
MIPGSLSGTKDTTLIGFKGKNGVVKIEPRYATR